MPGEDDEDRELLSGSLSKDKRGRSGGSGGMSSVQMEDGLGLMATDELTEPARAGRETCSCYGLLVWEVWPPAPLVTGVAALRGGGKERVANMSSRCAASPSTHGRCQLSLTRLSLQLHTTPAATRSTRHHTTALTVRESEQRKSLQQ